MASVKLIAGAELDLASGAELKEQTAQLGAKLDQLAAGPMFELSGALVTSDAGGLVGGGAAGNGVTLFRAPDNCAARISRLSVKSPSATPSSPITTGWMELYRDAPNNYSGLAIFLPISGVVAPVVVVEGRTDALLLRNGQPLVVIGSGLPVSTQFAFGFQIELISSNPTGNLG